MTEVSPMIGEQARWQAIDEEAKAWLKRTAATLHYLWSSQAGWSAVEVDDLEQIGRMALLRCAKSHTADMNVSLKGYSARAVRRVMKALWQGVKQVPTARAGEAHAHLRTPGSPMDEEHVHQERVLELFDLAIVENVMSQASIEDATAPDKKIEGVERRNALWRAMQSLNSEQRAVTMCQLQDLSEQATADKLGVARGVVRQRRKEAKAALMKLLSRHGDEMGE